MGLVTVFRVQQPSLMRMDRWEGEFTHRHFFIAFPIIMSDKPVISVNVVTKHKIYLFTYLYFLHLKLCMVLCRCGLGSSLVIKILMTALM